MRLLPKKAVVTALVAVSVVNAVAAGTRAIPGWVVADVVVIINNAVIITLLGRLPTKRAVARKTERPLRKMLGHGIRHELDDLDSLIQANEDRMPQATELCALATAYIAIDVCERWPLDVDLRELARRAAQSMTRLPVTEDEIYTYVSGVVFGFGRPDDIFPTEKTGRVPLYATANLLSKFSPGDKHWWEYLDQIWDAVETAGQTKSTVLPALMYRARADAAHAARQSAEQQHNTHHPERTRLTPGQRTRHERELTDEDARISELETDLGISNEDRSKLITVVARQDSRIGRLETENDQLKAEVAELEAEKKRLTEQP